MISSSKLAIHVPSHIMRFAAAFLVISVLLGCAVLGGAKPKPVAQGEVRFYAQQADKYLKEGGYTIMNYFE